MRRVVSYLLYSLDGVTEAPEKWVFDFDDDMMTHLKGLIASQDAVLLGRATYQMWAAYWPTSQVPMEAPFATFINGVAKYVASTTLTEATWPNTTVLAGPVAGEVTRLKDQPGKDIGVHGSTTLVRSLLRGGLLDELRLLVPPNVAGSGQRLFDQGDDARHLRLVEATPTSSGAVILAYQPGRTRNAGTFWGSRPPPPSDTMIDS